MNRRLNMTNGRMSWVLGFLVAFDAASASAQVYAPESEFHDKAQRLFPVEAARVLAWRENLNGQSICEVAYKVSVDTKHMTTWKVNWLDKDGKPTRQINVSYPEALLSEGPRFTGRCLSRFGRRQNARPCRISPWRS